MQPSCHIRHQKKLPRDQGSLSLAVSDVFYTSNWSWETSLPQLNLDTGFDIYLETRVVRLTYTRSFGNSQVEAASRRATGSQEEQRRVN